MDHAYAVEYTQTWSGGLQYQLAAVDDGRGRRTWDRGRSAPTTRPCTTSRSRDRARFRRAARFPQLGPIRSIRFDGKSIYHGVTFKAEQRLRNNYAYNVSYTLSTSIDDASSPGATEAETNLPQNVRNIFDETGEWAPSSFDHRHLFVASGSYQLPFFDGAGGLRKRCSAGGGSTRCSSRSRARRSR